MISASARHYARFVRFISRLTKTYLLLLPSKSFSRSCNATGVWGTGERGKWMCNSARHCELLGVRGSGPHGHGGPRGGVRRGQGWQAHRSFGSVSCTLPQGRHNVLRRQTQMFSAVVVSGTFTKSDRLGVFYLSTSMGPGFRKGQAGNFISVSVEISSGAVACSSVGNPVRIWSRVAGSLCVMQ